MIKFTKAHALGNDFMMIAWPQPTLPDPTVLCTTDIQRWSDRHCGIGFDQLILYHQHSDGVVDVLFYNADGSQAQACGNGYRALAKHLFHTTRETCYIMRATYGDIQSRILENEHVQLRLPSPIFNWQNIPQRTPTLADLPFIEGMIAPYVTVNVGNPHLVIFMQSFFAKDMDFYAPLLEKHASFPERINVSFAQVISPQEIQLRVWERGVGYTQACGTAACATASVAIQHGFSKCSDNIQVHQPGGLLTVSWDHNALWLTGEAVCVYQGILF